MNINIKSFEKTEKIGKNKQNLIDYKILQENYDKLKIKYSFQKVVIFDLKEKIKRVTEKFEEI